MDCPPGLAVNSLKKSDLETLNLRQIGNVLIFSICCSWKKGAAALSQSISTEKAQKYPFLGHAQFNVISYIESNKSTP